MVSRIKNALLAREDMSSGFAGKASSSPNIIFMYSGQGSQYYQMGRELYDNNRVFKQSMDQCSEILSYSFKRQIADIIYHDNKKGEDFDEIIYTHSVLFSFGYSLTQVLIENGIKPTGVLGYSLGEYIAATIAGVISLEEGLKLVQKQAELLHERCDRGGIISVIEPFELYQQQPELFQGTSLAGINYDKSFFISGYEADLLNVKSRLDKNALFSALLPIRFGFHSNAIDPVASDFQEAVSDIAFTSGKIPLYSSAKATLITMRTNEQWQQYLWDVVRGTIDFRGLFNSCFNNDSSTIFIDLSATGTLSGFLKHGFNDWHNHFYAVNQFGRDIESLEKLLTSLTSIKHPL